MPQNEGTLTFSQICVNVKTSEACKPIRSALRFMVHDIGQIYAKPHIETKGGHTFSYLLSVCVFF